MSTLRSEGDASRPWVNSMIWSRLRARPGRSQNTSSISNSAPVSSTRAPLGSNSRRMAPSSDQPANR